MADDSSRAHQSAVAELGAAPAAAAVPAAPVLAAVPAPAGPPPAGRDARPTAAQLAAKAARVEAALAEAIAAKDLTIFYRAFRAEELPKLPLPYNQNPRGLHRACFDLLRRLGAESPAVGLAIYNHYAVTCSLSTFPVVDNPALASRRRQLLETLSATNMLVANTTSRIHADKIESYGSLATREDGGFRLRGTAAYMSLATESELAFIFTGIENEGVALFMVPLVDNPGVEIGPFLFPTAMVDSDTRRITFNTFITPENMLEVDKSIIAFQVAWHQALFVAPFLGAAARALEETRKFLRSVRGTDDKPLAELDGMVTDLGRLAIRYRSACSFACQAGLAIEEVAVHPSAEKLTDAYHLACAAKHYASKCAEEIVVEARRIIGGRIFSGTHPMERISQEVMFGPLGGEINAQIERRYGKKLLGEAELLSHNW